MSERRGAGGAGLSLTTLAIAAVSSATVAVIVNQLWRPGTIIGAAITPVLVALISEALHHPAQRVTAGSRQSRGRERDRGRGAVRPVARSPATPGFSPPSVDRSVRRRRNVALAVLTGLAAFVIGAVALTGIELVAGGEVGGGGGQTTVFGGGGGGGGGGADATQTTTTTVTVPGAPGPTTTRTQTTPTPTRPTSPTTATTPPTTTTAPPATTTTPSPRTTPVAPAPATP